MSDARESQLDQLAQLLSLCRELLPLCRELLDRLSTNVNPPPRRRRPRRTGRPAGVPAALTKRQSLAYVLALRHAGNLAAAAREMRVTRQTFEQHHRAAVWKLVAVGLISPASSTARRPSPSRATRLAG